MYTFDLFHGTYSSHASFLTTALHTSGLSVSECPLILVIEDEYLLQADLEQALTDGGFACQAVYSGEEALRLFMTVPKGHYKGLVTDVSLTGRVNGWDVARRLRQKDPLLPIVYVTGHGAEWASQGVPQSILIDKPFATMQLVTALSTLLNVGTPPAL
jgi:DNA-binding response OmpR family regulator